MDDNCQTVHIGIGLQRPTSLDLLFNPKMKRGDMLQTGSLWDFSYGRMGNMEGMDGRIEPVAGPGCSIDPKHFGCYPAPDDTTDPFPKTPYSKVTIRPGYDSFIYLDVGFWGGRSKSQRNFGLVCGPQVWLCNYSQGGGAPNPGDNPYLKVLSTFRNIMGDFEVISHATLASPKFRARYSTNIYLILPDMHMWPDPNKVAAHRTAFFNPAEQALLSRSMKEGKVIRKPDGTLDVPSADPSRKETPMDHAFHMACLPEGRIAMKENALADVKKMFREEGEHGFGPAAGADLAAFLNRAKLNCPDIMVIHAGDLLEMWAPFHTWISQEPFQPGSNLALTAEAKKRISLWLPLIYNYRNNTAALEALKRAECLHLYGNHDIYLGVSWERTSIPAMDRLMKAHSYFCGELLWVEHGNRFQINNKDGYWSWDILNKPPGPIVTTAVNYYPDLRSLGDQYDNPQENLFKVYLPASCVWYLMAHHASIGTTFKRPPKFAIFCQAHTHSPVLLKVFPFWKKLHGAYP